MGVLPAERELRTNQEEGIASVTNDAPACIVPLLAGNEKARWQMQQAKDELNSKTALNFECAGCPLFVP